MGSAPVVVAVVGATASGKSGLSLDLAERLGGEVVNTDAMQLYRGMDVGTAKLPVAERRGVPHHLLDLLEVTEPATVAHFQELARGPIGELRAARAGAGAGRRLGALHPGGARPSSSSPAPTRRCAPGSRRRPRASAARRCTPGSPLSTPRPPPASSPRTPAASCAPSRWSS